MRFAFEDRSGKTVLKECFSKFPLQASCPSYSSVNSGEVFMYVINPAGGMVSGDRYKIDVTLKQDCKVFLGTTSANKIYRALDGEVVTQEVNFFLANGAILEYLPAHTIPYADSRYRENVEVFLGKDSVALILATVAPGRLGMGERLKYDYYESRLEVRTLEGQLLLYDKTVIEPKKEDYLVLGMLEGYSYLGTFYLCCTRDRQLDSSLMDILSAKLEGNEGVVGGLSITGCGGLVVRVLSHSISDLQRFFKETWLIVKKEVMGEDTGMAGRYWLYT